MALLPTKITTHVEDGLARLLSQFKDKTLVMGFIQAFLYGHQEVENAFYDLLTLRNIDAASGKQLDGIGEIVGKDRGGQNDTSYRISLYGKIGQNVSQGRAQDVISVFNLISEVSVSYMTEHWPAEIAIFAGSAPITGSQLLDDNDMEIAGLGFWTVVNGATLTKSLVTPYEGLQSLRVTYNAINNPAAQQTKLTIGNWYKVNGRVMMQNALGNLPIVTNGAVIIYTGFPYASWYEFDIIFQATATTIDFGSDHIAAGWVEYDDIEIYELNYDDQVGIFNVMELVAAGGVEVIGIGWYEDGDAFVFDGNPDGLGFSDALDPTLGGKFAALTAT